MFRSCVFTVGIFLFVKTINAQTVVKFRAGAGLPYEFSEKTYFSPYYSSPLDLPIQYDELQIERSKWSRGFPINYEFSAEVSLNKKSHFGFHVILNSGAGMGYKTRAYEPVPDQLNPGGTFINYYDVFNWHTVPLQKFYFSASRRVFGAFFKKKKDPEKKNPAISFDAGLSIGIYKTRYNKGLIYEYSLSSENLTLYDNVYILRRVTPAGMCFINMRIMGPAKHEICSLRLSYEQGFQKIASTVFDVQLNDLRTSGWVYSRGSGFSINLTFPVFSYNFTQKKFYRD